MRPNEATPQDKKEGIVYRHPVSTRGWEIVKKDGRKFVNGVVGKDGKWVPYTTMNHTTLRDAIKWADWQMNKMGV